MPSIAKIGTSDETQRQTLNFVFEEVDTANQDYGHQRFVYKKIVDAGVSGIIGSPVGETHASGGGTVTPDFSDVDGYAILRDGGGLLQFASTSGTTYFGYVQSRGIIRTTMKTTGALAAGARGEWTDDDTIAAFTNAGTIFCKCLVVAAAGVVPVGGARLL